MPEPRILAYDGHGAPLLDHQLDPRTYCLAQPSTRVIVKQGLTPICTLQREHDGPHFDEDIDVDWTEIRPGIYIHVRT